MISFQYNVFYQVATNLSFSKAAKILFISQPAVSKHIKKLESETGSALFERNGSSILLTSSGEKLLSYLHKAKNIERVLKSDLEIIKTKEHVKGELRIGASTTISLYVLPKVLSLFHKQYPNILILLKNRNSENIQKALLNKEIDLAVVEEHHKGNAFQSTFFMEDEIIPVCSSSSPYAQSKTSIVDLKEFPLIMREQGSGTLAAIVKELSRHKVKLKELKIMARLGGTEALKNYLIEDEAIGFLSKMAITKELESDTLRAVQLESFKAKRKFYFVTRKGEDISGMIKTFVEIGKSIYN